MPDPILPTPSSLPQTPVAPALPNPQDLVDAALSGDATTPKTEVVESPKTESPKTESLPPLTPLTPVVEPTPAPTPIPEPIAPVLASANITMGDETPLAFAGMPTPTTTATMSTELSQPVETSTQNGASLPPIAPLAPEPKQKGKLGKMVVGIIALVLVLFGGVAGYQYFTTGEIPLVAVIIHLPGGGIIDAGSGSGRVSNVNHEQVIQHEAEQNVGDPNDDAYNTDLAAEQARLQALADAEAARLAQSMLSDSISIANGNVVLGGNCQANSGVDKCGDDKGICYNGVCVPSKTCTGNCPISCTGNYQNSGGSLVQEPGRSFCNPQGQYCQVTRIEWSTNGTNTGTHCFVTQNEDCSGSCDSTTVVTEPSPSPSAPPLTPVMSCTGITSAPAVTPAPVVGTKMTFTCAGTVTPTTAGTLSYKFRYSINSGAVTAMTNSTATTSELTIAACGTYKVECQACATLNGVLTCSPVWTGATQ